MSLRLLPGFPDKDKDADLPRRRHPSLDAGHDSDDDPIGDAIRQLMSRHHCTPYKALSMLIVAAAHTDRSIADQARHLLDQ